LKKGWAGFDIGPKKKMEFVDQIHSLMFTDVKVPKENRIGADGLDCFCNERFKWR
jgi:alkylation response protein AidB-like acyl-CoA dehydrogenase